MAIHKTEQYNRGCAQSMTMMLTTFPQHRQGCPRSRRRRDPSPLFLFTSAGALLLHCYWKERLFESSSSLGLLLPVAHAAWSSSSQNDCNAITRRSALRQAVAGAGILTVAGLPLVDSNLCSAFAAPTTTPPPTTTSNANDIEARLSSTILKQQPVSSVSSGVDNTVYPDFLEGTWQVTQTLVSVETPLGLKFAGGPNGIVAIAEKSLAESKSRLYQPVSLQLRFVKSASGVVEDRLFNTRQRLDSFAGKSVVASVDYADTRASNRAAMRSLTKDQTGKNDNDFPLTATTTYFKGPAAQKTFVTAHHEAVTVAAVASNRKDDASSCSGDTATSWTGFESQRSIFALTNASTAPPITTDSELIFQFLLLHACGNSNSNNIKNNHVTGRLRIAGFLNPNDVLYFEARNRAVTLQDYTLDLQRIP